MTHAQPNQPDDESLGVEQLPEDELSASPGDEDIQASNPDVNDAGVATTSADLTEQQNSESVSSPASE
ncbi:MAG: hypothetical protein KME10_21515 [Plectolyngbya sp. WJT66-NPBG17]|jgi:hypothetical protein|nr:hypothetical protein [Plectolyngbya sp. WJT66-NPBG17]